jgi:recombination protein RecT
MVVKEQPFPIQIKSELLAREEEFAATLQSIGIDEQRFIRVGLLYITQNRNLWKCSKSSIVLALLESARAGLMVDGKQAAILPYKDQATFMPMTFGIIALMLRSPRVTNVEARPVYEGDEFAYRYGTRPDLTHVPLGEQNDDKLTHAYAVMWRQGAPHPTFEVMTREEIEQVRAVSRNSHHADSPWVKWYSEMARKSAVKRLSKYADLAPEAQQAIQMDHEIFGDPGTGSYVEGLSEDYQSQLTKSYTQDGIADLKERMKNGAEPDPEPGPEPDPEPEPRTKNKWEPNVVDFIAETQLVDGKDDKQVKLHIRKILNRSPFMSVPFGDLDVVEATAFVIGRNLVMEEYPDLESKERYVLLLEWWADETRRKDMIERALKMVPPEEPTGD